MRKRALVTTLASASALVAAAAVATPLATASAAPSLIANSRPSWLGHAQHLGQAHPSARLSARVYLAPKTGIDALRQQALAVSTPGNAQYRHFLTAAQYQAKYGVTKAALNGVESWLTGAGFKITQVGRKRSYVAITGTVRQAEQAFGAQLERYRHNGQTVRANSTTLRVPAGVASSVLSVTGLDTTRSVAKPLSGTPAPPPPGFRVARPCSVFYGQIKARFQADFTTRLPKFTDPATGKTAYHPYNVCGYNGPQFRAAYENGINADGSGATVAIVDAFDAPTIVSDTSRYAVENGDGAYAPGQLKLFDAKTFKLINACGASGWFGEQTLDIEVTHAMAPGADIRYYGAASCTNNALINAEQKVVNQDKAQIVSNSWGEPEEGATTGVIAKFEQIFMQGAVEGISFAFSSGDSGDEGAATGIRQADYPTSDPFVTSVGGTTTAIGGNGRLRFTTGWGTDRWRLSPDGQTWVEQGFTSGAGGGESHLFDMPAYQNGVVPGAARAVPDVAFDADPTTGFLVGETQTFPEGVSFDEFRIGGTSLSSPMFAGMTALGIGADGGVGFGLLNPVIYANPAAFTDVTGNGAEVGNARVDFVNSVDATDGLAYTFVDFNHDSSLTVGPGWDDVTGLGYPNANWVGMLAAGH